MNDFLTVLSLLGSSFIAVVLSSGGSSNVYHAQDGQGNYGFAYDISDPWGATNFREESGSFDPWGGSVVGSYGLADVDGRKRLVQYSADKNGFVAYIKTNEPGTSDEDAADAYYNGVDWSGGKWLYDFSIKHDKDPWGKSKDPWGKSKDTWGKSLDKVAKKPSWSASALHEVNIGVKSVKGEIFLDPKTRELYEAIDDHHVVPLGRTV